MPARMLWWAIALLAATAGPALAAERPKANDCADAYWAQTLRCQYTAEGEAPQLNLGDAPAGVADIHPFTRVFLTRDPSIRSVDGTYPAIYVDKAVCTNVAGCGEVPYLEPIDSDKWLITMPGGGSCLEESCVSAYADPEERGEMSTGNDAPTKTLNGIHIPAPSINPVFAGYNRIRVEKSTYDRYQGRATYESQDGLQIFNHGFRLMEESVRALRKGLRYDTWIDRGGNVAQVSETLPKLADAEQVVFAGHSGGSHGLVHNIDHLAALLDSFGGFEGDVRAIFDENFVPGIQNESAFTLPPGRNAYADAWAGDTSAQGIPFSYDGELTLTSEGIHTIQYNTWDAPRDASCIAHHEATDGATWKCNERQHVLLNHVDVPFFVKQDFSDPNTEHNNNPIGHQPTWGVDGITFSQSEFAMRVMAQATSLIELARTESEPAGLGKPFPLFFAWIGNCATHNGVYDNEVYYPTGFVYQATRHSLREWVERFVRTPPDGASEYRVHRYGEPDPLADTLPPPGSMLSDCGA